MNKLLLSVLLGLVIISGGGVLGYTISSDSADKTLKVHVPQGQQKKETFMAIDSARSDTAPSAKSYAADNINMNQVSYQSDSMSYTVNMRTFSKIKKAKVNSRDELKKYLLTNGYNLTYEDEYGFSFNKDLGCAYSALYETDICQEETISYGTYDDMINSYVGSYEARSRNNE